MALKIPDGVLTTLCDTLVDRIDAGAGAGTLKIYNGTQPADPDAAITDTLLATITFSDPAFGSAVIVSSPVDAGEATASAMTDETSATAGTAGWFLIEDSNTVRVLTGTITVTSGGGDLELSTLTIPGGGTVSITSAKIRVTRNP